MSKNEDVGAHLRVVIARYGTEQVPAARLYEHFHVKAALPAQGFTVLKAGLYARAVHDEVVQLVKLMAYKGGVYSLSWGVSLAWLPHAFKPKPLYHRTLKAARFDLFEWASTIEPRAGESPNDWFVSPNHGPQYMALTFDAMWSRLAPRLFEFLDRVRSPEAVLAAARVQAQGAGQGGVLVQ